MPITFSSFGDVATVLQLAWQLRAALSDASGASAEIRALLIDVDSFTRALQQTKAAVEQRRTPLAPAIDNGIKYAIIACHDALRLILRKIDAFKTRITNRVGAAAWRQYWAVAAWSILGGKKEVDALRVRLSEQIGVVQTYLSLAQSNDQAKVQETVESQGVALNRIYSVMQDIQIRFDVGVPSFHFFDERIGYYTPFARTSLQRLIDLSESMGCLDILSSQLDQATNYRKYANWRLRTLSTSEPLVVTVNLVFAPKRVQARHPQAVYGQNHITMKLCIFKERAFDKWQVLLGCPYVDICLDMQVLKLLVEHSHRIGSRCHCTFGVCRDQVQGCINQATHWRPFYQAMSLLSQIKHLAMHWGTEQRASHSAACGDLLEGLWKLDIDFIQQSIIPLLQLHVECQHPSLPRIRMALESGPHMATLKSGRVITHCSSPMNAFSHWRGRCGCLMEYMPPGYILSWL